MITRKSTVIEIVFISIATVILCMALLTFNVQAQELVSTSDQTTMQSFAPKKNGAGGNASSNNTTKTKAEILKERGVLGKGINQAPGLQKPFNPNSSAAEHAGKVGISDNRTTAFSNNRTMPPPFSGNQTMTRAEIQKQLGVPGKGIDTAPGLQKQFKPNSANDNGRKIFLYRWQQRFREMMQNFSNGERP